MGALVPESVIDQCRLRVDFTRMSASSRIKDRISTIRMMSLGFRRRPIID